MGRSDGAKSAYMKMMRVLVRSACSLSAGKVHEKRTWGRAPKGTPEDCSRDYRLFLSRCWHEAVNRWIRGMKQAVKVSDGKFQDLGCRDRTTS